MTRLIEFGRFAASNRRQRGEGKPETFTFLGFTHYCGTNSNGHFVFWRCPAAKRMREPAAQAGLEPIASDLCSMDSCPTDSSSLSLLAIRRSYEREEPYA